MPVTRRSDQLLFRHVFQPFSQLKTHRLNDGFTGTCLEVARKIFRRRNYTSSPGTQPVAFPHFNSFCTNCELGRAVASKSPQSLQKLPHFSGDAEHSHQACAYIPFKSVATCGGRCIGFTTQTSNASGRLLPQATSKGPQYKDSHQRLQRRFVRTGFFHSDPDFIDPEDALFAEPAEEWCHADGGGALTEAVLERSNVGMGMCILNRGVLDSEAVFGLYRRLRNLEVNPLKRFCCLTTRRRSMVPTGLCYSKLLAFAEQVQTARGSAVPASALWYLQNAWELHAVVHSYSKPLLVLLNGRAEGEGAALCFLANRSAAYKHSAFTCDTTGKCIETTIGLTPTLGLTFALGRLRGSLGAFLALTGHELKGQDLIWSGLCKYWVSPEAMHFMELTAEKQLEVSEQDAKALLEEHFLEPPQAYSLDPWEEVIDDHFNHSTLEEILQSLDSASSSRRSHHRVYSSISADRVAAWAAAVAARIRQRSPLACKLTLELLQRQKQLQEKILEDANITPYEWRKIKSLDSVLPSNVQDDSMKQVLEAVDEQLLAQALENEMRVALRLLGFSKDLVEGLRSRLLEDAPDLCTPPQWSDACNIALDPFFAPLPQPIAAGGNSSRTTADITVCKDPYGLFERADFVAEERTQFPSPSHPLVARLAPAGGGGGLSERQQARLNARWNRDFFQGLLKKEGF
ncbi:hypothetical protein Efla_003863 [Eimeria flavescens]